MNSYAIRTNLLVSALAAIITVLIQVTLFETTYRSTPLTGEQIVAMNTMTVDERFRYAQENRMVATGLENLKGYFSSSEALLILMKRRALPIFLAVFVSLFVVNLWQGKQKTKQTEHL